MRHSKALLVLMAVASVNARFFASPIWSPRLGFGFQRPYQPFPGFHGGISGTGGIGGFRGIQGLGSIGWAAGDLEGGFSARSGVGLKKGIGIGGGIGFGIGKGSGGGGIEFHESVEAGVGAGLGGFGSIGGTGNIGWADGGTEGGVVAGSGIGLKKGIGIGGDMGLGISQGSGRGGIGFHKSVGAGVGSGFGGFGSIGDSGNIGWATGVPPCVPHGGVGAGIGVGVKKGIGIGGSIGFGGGIGFHEGLTAGVGSSIGVLGGTGGISERNIGRWSGGSGPGDTNGIFYPIHAWNLQGSVLGRNKCGSIGGTSGGTFGSTLFSQGSGITEQRGFELLGAPGSSLQWEGSLGISGGASGSAATGYHGKTTQGNGCSGWGSSANPGTGWNQNALTSANPQGVYLNPITEFPIGAPYFGQHYPIGFSFLGKTYLISPCSPSYFFNYGPHVNSHSTLMGGHNSFPQTYVNQDQVYPESGIGDPYSCSLGNQPFLSTADPTTEKDNKSSKKSVMPIVTKGF